MMLCEIKEIQKLLETLEEPEIREWIYSIYDNTNTHVGKVIKYLKSINMPRGYGLVVDMKLLTKYDRIVLHRLFNVGTYDNDVCVFYRVNR
jgi:hypothetical protein